MLRDQQSDCLNKSFRIQPLPGISPQVCLPIISLIVARNTSLQTLPEDECLQQVRKTDDRGFSAPRHTTVADICILAIDFHYEPSTTGSWVGRHDTHGSLRSAAITPRDQRDHGFFNVLAVTPDVCHALSALLSRSFCKKRANTEQHSSPSRLGYIWSWRILGQLVSPFCSSRVV